MTKLYKVKKVNDKPVVNVRCSRLPLLFACAQSGRGNPVKIEGYDLPARIGSAVHKALEYYITGQNFQIETIAQIYNLDKKSTEELRLLFALGRIAWDEQISRYFGSGVAVEELHETTIETNEVTIHLTGTADAAAMTITGEEPQSQILDWKSGHKTDTDYSKQGLGYSYLYSKKHDCMRSIFIFGFLRNYDKDIKGLGFRPEDVLEFNEADFVQFENDLIEIVTAHDPPYRPGTHCVYCPRRFECEGYQSQIADNALVLPDYERGGDEFNALINNPGVGYAMYEAAGVIEKKAKLFRENYKALIEAKGGEVDVPCGGSLKLKTINRTKIDGLKAFPVVSKHLKQDQINSCMTLSKGKMTDIIGAQTETGKGKAKKAFIAELEAVDAIIPDYSYTQIQFVKGKIDGK